MKIGDHLKKTGKGAVRRGLSLLVAVSMLLSWVPPVYAVDAVLCEHHPEHTADCGDPCTFRCDICAAPVATPEEAAEATPAPENANRAGKVQALIDALPDADAITAENSEEVKAQLAAIDAAKLDLTDEELDALDVTRYIAAVAALHALEDQTGAETPEKAPLTAAECSHTTIENGKCTTCGMVIAVKVEVEGGDAAYYNHIDTAWAAAQGKTATVTLLADQTATKTLEVIAGSNVTVKAENNATLTTTSETGSYYHMFVVSAGTITFESGTFNAPGTSRAIYVPSTGGTVILRGGTFVSDNYAIYTPGQTVGSLLADGYGYQRQNGSWYDSDQYKENHTQNAGTVKVCPIPLKIVTQPVGPTEPLAYGYTEKPTMTITVEKMDSQAQAIDYLWYRVKEGDEQYDTPVNAGVKSSDGLTSTFTVPTGLGAGTHQFYCDVQYHNCKLLSERATVTVTPIEVSADPILEQKTYDGTVNGAVSQVVFQTADPAPIPLVEGTDYTVAVVYDSADVGLTNATVTVTLLNENYVFEDGTKTQTRTRYDVSIKPKEITPTVTLDRDSFGWTGNAIEPTVKSVTYTEGDQTITLDPDQYEIEYSNNINPGENTAIVTVKGKNNYMFTATANFTITCPHPDMDTATKTCTLCGAAIVAKVEADGNAPTYYTDFNEAWGFARGKTATVTLLADATASDTLSSINGNITVKAENNATLTFSSADSLFYVTSGSVTFESGNYNAGNGSHCILVSGGTLNVKGGTFKAASGMALSLETGGSVTLSGGTFRSGNSGAVRSDTTLGDLLADGYGYKKDDGTWVQGEDLEKQEAPRNATLTVTSIPVKITAQPATPADELTYGDTSTTAQMTVTAQNADGSATGITYQWYRVKEGDETDDVEVPGATGAALTIPTGLDAGDHRFYCVATCDGYELKSNPAAVTVKPCTINISRTTLDFPKNYDGTTDVMVTRVDFVSGFKNVTLTIGTDYTVVAKSESADVGTWNVTATTTLLNPNYVFDNGTKIQNSTIQHFQIRPKPITPTITLNQDSFVYTGSEIKPTVASVTYTEGDQTITLGSDQYEIEYSNNINPGENTAIVTVRGTKNYSFTTTVHFTITCPHTSVDVATGRCGICGGTIVVKVETDGATTFYDDIRTAWNFAQGKTAIVTLLANATVSGDHLEVPSGTDITMRAENNATLTCMGGGATVLFNVDRGAITFESGTFDGGNFRALFVEPLGGTVTLRGGTFSSSGNNAIETFHSGHTLESFLADGYGYKKADGSWIQGDDLKQRETGVGITVTILPIPVKITVQPDAAATTYGTAADLSVTAEATGTVTNITYQWYRVKEGTETDDVALPGATGATYATDSRLSAGDHQFYCVVTCDGYKLTSEKANVTVEKKRLTATITGTTTKVYDGTGDVPADVSIRLDGVLSGDDVTITVSAYTYGPPNVGTKTIVASVPTLQGDKASNYSVSDPIVGSGEITPRPLTIKASDQTITYGGTIATGTDQVTTDTLATGDTLESITLTPSTADVPGGTITPSDAVLKNAANEDVTGNYTITYETGSLTINQAALTDLTVTLSPDTFVYDGSAKEPTVTVKKGDVEIPSTEYAVTYRNNTNAGTANVNVVATGNYSFTVNKTFTIDQADISVAVVTVEEECRYNGYKWSPDPVVKLDGTTLVRNMDYDVTYGENVNAGTGTLTVKGMGNYTGTKEVTFPIEKAALTIKASDQTITYGGTIATGTGQVTTGTLATGDTLESITLAPSTADVPGGTITPSAAVLKNAANEDVTGNYSITYETGKLTIDKAVITDIAATVNDVEAPEATSAVQETVSGGDGYTAAIAWSPEANGVYDFNTVYTATLTLTPDANHEFGALTADGWTITENPDGTVTLQKAFDATRKEKITAVTGLADQTLPEGDHKSSEEDVIGALPTTVTVTLESGDTVDLPITWKCDGNYDTTPEAPNTFTWTVTDTEPYDAAGVTLTGSITVTNPAPLTVTIIGNDKTVTYDGGTVDLSELFTIDENAGPATYSIPSKTGDGTLDGSTLTVNAAGTFTVAVHTEKIGIYDEGTATATLTVEKGTGSGTVTLTGWVYGAPEKQPVAETATNDPDRVTFTYTPDVTPPKGAGEYTVTATFEETDLYNACTASTTFTITPRPLTVTIAPNSVVYGAVQPATAELGNTRPGYADPIVTLTYTGTTNADVAINSTDVPQEAGTYTVTATISDSNYTLEGDTTAPFVVERADCGLTVEPAEETKVYGDADFTLTATHDGPGAVSYTSSDTAVVTVDETGTVHIVSVGTAKITVTVPRTDNYNAATVEVPVTVDKKPIKVVVEDKTKTYGDPDPELTYTLDGAPVGDDTLKLELSYSGENVGTYDITASGAEADNPNYAITVEKGTMTIAPRSIDDAEVVLGKALIANGTEQTQTIESVTVKNSEGEDLAVTYDVSGNTGTEAGRYEMTITGTGNFTGEITLTFNIGAPVDDSPEPTQDDKPKPTQDDKAKPTETNASKDEGNAAAAQNSAAATSIPRTGDNSYLELWIAMMALSAAGFAALTTAKRKNNK